MPASPPLQRTVTRKASAAREDLRFRILRLLQDSPQMSHREIARSLGVSTGGVNYCVNALIDKGLVKVRNFRASNNKLKYAYVLTPRGVSEKTALTARFLQRKMAEYEALKSEIEAVRAEMGTQARPSDRGAEASSRPWGDDALAHAVRSRNTEAGQ